MDDAPVEYSSSIIGIVTAVCGNIIISIALNLQRYAHLRLKREGAASERVGGLSSSSASSGSDADEQEGVGGTVQSLERMVSGEDGEHNVSNYGALQNFDEAAAAGSPKSAGSPVLLEVIGKDDVRLADRAAGRAGTIGGGVASRAKVLGIERTGSATESVGGHEGKEKIPGYMKSGYWWLGIVLMVTGEAGNFLAYGFAPASTVSPLGVVALISNCIVAPIFFHENFRVRDLLGVLVAILGAVVVVLASNPQEDYLDAHRILQAVSQLSFQIYVVITLVLIAVLVVASGRYGERWIMIDISLVALFGAYTALSTKALSSLLTYTLYRVFTFPITYALIAVLVLTAVMQVKYLSRALQHFDSTQVIPTHFVFFTLSVIIGSAILYQDFDGTSRAKTVQFFTGCLLTFAGVRLITSNRPAPNAEGEDAELDGGENGMMQDEFYSSIASVNLDRSNGAHTPTSFYDDDDDALEIGDADAVVARRTRVEDLIESSAAPAAAPTTTTTTTTTAPPRLAVPAAVRPTPRPAVLTAVTDEDVPLLNRQPPPLARFASSPGSTSRSYVPGAGMGLIVDSANASEL
ncbi:magnesium transporter NIPA-domain-containing protein [Myxozyma melibiosi]|uniref:Magnesium transporter NIPA-domain-containing protein n=1 Tax=Myxozyma melibiosi TaxID=54550 RepID=A0ABR1F278_9ASCO